MTSRDGPEAYSLLIEIGRSADVARVRRALDLAGMPFRSGLLAGSPPRMLFYVPASRLDEARAALGRLSEYGLPADPQPEPAPGLPADAEAPARFPAGAVQIVAAVLLLHVGLVGWILGPGPPGAELFRAAGLVPERIGAEPWRLITAMFLHVDLAHALWNGLSMLIFAVPLLTRLGVARTALIYLVAGIGGGLTAVAFARDGTVIIGSSGAVAGLFGGWIVYTLVATRHDAPGWRYRVRILGVALLFLPSLLNPTTSTGQSVSVTSHLGGLLTGMLIGALISARMVLRGDSGATIEPIPD